MLGYQAIPELIRRHDLPAVFTMLAHTNAPWLGYGMENGHFRLVKTRHEETAVGAATSFTRVTGKLGVVSVQRGPGFANSVNALLAASHCHSPLLLIVAESPATKELSAKNIDQKGFTRLIGAGFHHATQGRELEAAFAAAIADARWNGAPQVLSIGDGVLDEEIVLSDLDASVAAIPAREDDEIDPESITAAVDALEKAKRPLILAGQGVIVSRCEDEVTSLADLTGAGLTTSLYATQLFHGHPHNLGLCGTWAPTATLNAISEADLILAVGASLNKYTTAEHGVLAGKKVIHVEVDIDRPILASPPELAILGDAKAVVGELIEEWKRRGLGVRQVDPPWPTFESLREAMMKVDLGHDAERGLDLRSVVARLDALLPEDRIIVTDSGRHMAPLPTLLRAPSGRNWIISRGYGSVGLGISAAVGAACGETGRKVVLFCGDGGFMMGAQGLDCFRINGLDVTIVILNDEQYGAELGALRQYGLQSAIAEQPMPDIELLAQSLGARGEVVRSYDDLERVDFAAPGVLFVDIRIDPKTDHFSAVG